MGSPSPGTTKLKKESFTIKTAPHRRSSSVSSCISLESIDKEASSPAKSNGLGKSPTASTSSPRSPAGVPREKSTSPAHAMKKRRPSIGGSDDVLARGLDFGTPSPPVAEKKHPYLARGGGHKSIARPASPATQLHSPGKKANPTPPGKERLLGRATSTSMLSPRKSDVGKKDLISPRQSVEGLRSTSGITNSNCELESNAGSSDTLAEAVTSKKSSPRVSLDGKLGKSSPRPALKYSRSDLGASIGRTNSNGEMEGEEAAAKSEKSSPKVSSDSKIGKASPRPSLKVSGSDLTSSKGRKSTIGRQETPSPPQLGRVRRKIDKSAHNEELMRPEMESVEVQVYSENECEKGVTSEDVVNVLHQTPAPLPHPEVGEDGSTLLSSLMDSGDEEEELRSLEHGGEPKFDHDKELSTSWLSEDLPSMFSSLSHLPEPDDSSSSLLGDPPDVADEPFLMAVVDVQGSSDESLLAGNSTDDLAAEITRNLSVFTAECPVTIPDDKFVAADYSRENSNGLCQPALDESARNPNFNTLPVVENSVDKFEAELPTHEVTTHERELQQTSVPPFAGDCVAPMVEVQSLSTLDEGEAISCKFITHTEDKSSSTGPNELSSSETLANEAFLQNTRVTQELPSVSGEAEENNLHFLLSSVEGESQPILHQIVKHPTEGSQVMPQPLKDDGEIGFPDPPYCSEDMRSSEARPILEEEGQPEDKLVSTTHSSLDLYEIESSDEETLEEIIEDSLSESSADETLEEMFEDSNSHAQLNLKQSFDDVAEHPVDSRSQVDEFCDVDLNPANIPSIVPAMVGARDDTCVIASDQVIGPREIASQTEDLTLLVSKPIDQPESTAESRDVLVCGASAPTQDMDIFEEYYWTQNVADESSQSDAGQNDAEDLHLYSSNETQLLNSVQEETEKSLPPVELPVSALPIVSKLKLTMEESIDFEPPGHTSSQLDASKLETMDDIDDKPPGLPCPESTASLPASENNQIDRESAVQEEAEQYDEVFHLPNGTELSTDNLSSPSGDLTHEPPHLILSESFEDIGFDNADESNSSLSPTNSTSMQGTEHSDVLDALQANDQSLPKLDMLQERDVERDAEYESFPGGKLLVQDSSALDIAHDLVSPVEVEAKPDTVASNLHHPEGSVDQEPTHENPDEPPRLAVIDNGLLNLDILEHLDGSAAIDDSVKEHDLSPAMQHATLKSSSESADDVLDLDLETPTMHDGLEVGATSVQTSETGDRNGSRDDDSQNLVSDECLLEVYSHDAMVAAEIDDSRDLGSEFPPKVLMVEGSQNILDVSWQPTTCDGAATEEVDPFEANTVASLILPTAHRISEEDLPEVKVLSSMDEEEDSPSGEIHNTGHDDTALNLGERQDRSLGISIPDNELQINLDQEVSQESLLDTLEQAELVKDNSGCIPDSELILDSTKPSESFQENNSETREHDSAVHDSSQMRLSVLLPLEASPLQPLQSEDDESSIVPGTQTVVESYEVVNMTGIDSPISSPGSETTKNFSGDEKMDFETAAAAADNSDPEVNSTAFLDRVAVGTNTLIPSTEATTTSGDCYDTDSWVGVREEDHLEATPTASGSVELSAIELQDRTLNEVRELNWHEVKCRADEEKTPNETNAVGAVDFEEQSMRERGWGGQLPATEIIGSKSSPEDERDLVTEEAIFTNASSSIVADESDSTENLPEIDLEKSEESSSITSTSSSSLGETKDHDEQDLQESPLHPGTSTRTDDHDSRTSALITENVLVTSSLDAAFDDHWSDVDSIDDAVKDVGTVSENCSARDLSEELFAASGQDTPKAALFNVEDTEKHPDSSCNTEKELGERVNESLEDKSLLEDKDKLVDSPKKFVVSSQDAPISDVEGLKENTEFSWDPDEEGKSSNRSLEEMTLHEDEVIAVDTPRSSVHVSGQDTPEPTILTAIDIQNHSNVAQTPDKEESLNGSLEEDSMQEDEDLMDPSGQDTLDTQIFSANDIQEHSGSPWKAVNEDDLNEREAVLEDEDTVLCRSKNLFDDSSQDSSDTTENLSVDDSQNHSNVSQRADKEGESLNEKLEQEIMLKDEEMVVDSPENSVSFSGQDIPVDTPILSVEDSRDHSNVSHTADKEEESLHEKLEQEFMLKEEEMVVDSPELNLVSFPGQDVPVEAPIDLGVSDVQNHSIDVFREADEQGQLSSNDKSEQASMLKHKETVVDSPELNLIVFSGQDSPVEAPIDLDVIQDHSNDVFREADKETESLNGSLREDSMLEDEETVDTPETKTLAVNDTQSHANISRKDDKGEESFNGSLDEELPLEDEDTVVYRPMDSVAVSGQDTPDTAILRVNKSEEHSNTLEISERAGERLNGSLEEEPIAEVKDSPMETSVASSQATTNEANFVDVDNVEKHLTWPESEKKEGTLNASQEEESTLEVEDKVVKSSPGSVENASASFADVDDALDNRSGNFEEEFMPCPSKADIDGAAMTSHDERPVENQTMDAVPVSVDANLPEDTISLVGQDSDSDQLRRPAAEDTSSSPVEIITNPKHLRDNSESLNGVVTDSLVEQTGANDLVSVQDTPVEVDTEPQSPVATLYPNLAQPPFSGSQQDRLWEEQAEAYSSGGRGTPARNEDHASQAATFPSPSAPGESAAVGEDQIQPASGPANNGHAQVLVGSSSNGSAGENGGAQEQQKGNGKGKPHTPLRSLLLEDASKSGANGDSTGLANGGVQNPSFIRRLFRVKSTPSRAPEKDVGQAKHKKSSSSMWISCLGMPQVQQ